MGEPGEKGRNRNFRHVTDVTARRLRATDVRVVDVPWDAWLCDNCHHPFGAVSNTLPLCCPICGVWYDTMPVQQYDTERTGAGG